jgi:PAS domain S-box-containing protein
LILGEEVSGALLLIHRQPGAFMIEQVTMVEATARQFGVALNNAELFTLIRDQAENLGGLLREQQIEASRSRAILESVADGVVVTDQNMQITLFNASAERILETKASDALGKSLESFAGLFGSAEPAWHQTIVRWSESGREHLAGETFAEQINLDSGRVLAVNLAPVFFRGRFQATVSIFRDITHEIQVDRLKSEFVANVSHELRTPMTSIKGYVEIMLMGAAGELSPQQRHFLEIVKGNTERLKILVNDLLDVSKIEAGGVVLSLQAVDLTEIIAEVINDIQRRGRQEGKSIKFQADLEPGVPNVMGDAVRIRQVLANLVTNGYNYTPENGSVTVRLRSKGNEVLVEVVDTGIGIASKDQARIFERFYRGEDPLVLATAGTGLGLAISKILVEMHHGQIGFSSSGVRGEGSTFYFSLPVAHNEE